MFPFSNFLQLTMFVLLNTELLSVKNSIFVPRDFDIIELVKLIASWALALLQNNINVYNKKKEAGKLDL